MRLIKRSLDGGYTFVIANEVDFTIPYAILSHTWGADEEELSYQDIINGGKDKSLAKLEFTLKQAAKDDLSHVWIDTCCINKWNSTELNEAINSMFKWYAHAEICYAFLFDAPEVSLESSRWFTRGWTLQELVAPRTLEFFDRNGNKFGSRPELAVRISAITGVEVGALRTGSIEHVVYPDRMKWANTRTTKKPQDMVYCLLGLLDISMSLMYGEDLADTYRRLFSAIDDKHGRPVGEALRASLLHKEPHTARSSITESMLMQALGFDGMRSRREHIDAPYCGTTDWLLRNSEYVQWLAATQVYDSEHEDCGTSRFVWIKGHPGAGKSTLMRYADTMAARLQQREVLQVTFYFNARGGPLEHSTEGLYRSLLLQIMDNEQQLQRMARDYLKAADVQFSSGTITWTTHILQNLLAHMIGLVNYRHIRCFVDALDECPTPEVRQMINFLHQVSRPIFSKVRFHVCFASRYYPALIVPSCAVIRLDEQAEHIGSVEAYVLQRLQLADDDHAKRLQQEVITKAKGVYMWAALVINMLNDEIADGRLDRLASIITSLPSELEGIYERLVARHSKDDDMFYLATQINYFCSQPLTGHEYYYMLLFATKQMPANTARYPIPNNETLKRFVSSSSRGLAELNISTDVNRVQFIHESVRDFLKTSSPWSVMFPDTSDTIEKWSHERISQILTEYLSELCDAPRGLSTWLKELADLGQSLSYSMAILHGMPLLHLINQMLLRHVGMCTRAVQKQLLKSTSWPEMVQLAHAIDSAATQTIQNPIGLMLKEAHCLVSMIFELDSQDKVREILGPFPVAELIRLSSANALQDAPGSLGILLENDCDANQKDSLGATALGILLRHDREHMRQAVVAKALLDHGADPDSWSCVNDGSNARGGDPVLISCLDFSQDTKFTVLNALLEKGVNVNVQRSEDGTTALMKACTNGDLKSMKALLRAGANPNVKSFDKTTALFCTAFREKTYAAEIVVELVQHGADVHAVNRKGVSVLPFWVKCCLSSAWSATTGAAILHTLVVHGADPTQIDITGRSALNVVHQDMNSARMEDHTLDFMKRLMFLIVLLRPSCVRRMTELLEGDETQTLYGKIDSALELTQNHGDMLLLERSLYQLFRVHVALLTLAANSPEGIKPHQALSPYVTDDDSTDSGASSEDASP